VSEQNKETSGADEGRLDATTVMEEPDGHLVRVVALNMVDWIQTSIVVESKLRYTLRPHFGARLESSMGGPPLD
jgi:hypothetical protein